MRARTHETYCNVDVAILDRILGNSNLVFAGSIQVCVRANVLRTVHDHIVMCEITTY